MTLKLLICVLVAVLGPVSLAEARSPEGPQHHDGGSIRRSVYWDGKLGEQRSVGLYLVDLTTAGMVSRLLAEDPSGRLIRLTQILDAHHGRQETEFLDDTSGWWAKLTLETEFRGETLQEYFALGREKLVANSEASVLITLSTQSDLRFEAKIPLTDPEPERLYNSFAEEAAETDFPVWLRREMPDGVSRAVGFLYDFMSPSLAVDGNQNVAYHLRAVVEVLASLCSPELTEGVSDGENERTWVMRVGDMTKGLGPLKGKEREFVSRFRSVSSTDPLSDSRAALVFTGRRNDDG